MKFGNSPIKKGAMWSYILIFTNIALGFLYTPFLIEKIGKSDYGLYTLAMSIISIITLDYGLGQATSKFLSNYKAKNEQHKESGFLGHVFKLYFFIDIFILFALVLIIKYAENIYTELTIAEIERLKIVFIIVGAYTLITFPCIPFKGILISNEKFSFIKKVQLATRVFTVTIMVLMLFLGLGLYTLVFVNAFIMIIARIYEYAYLKKRIGIKVDMKYREKRMLKNIFSYSIWMTINSVSKRLSINLAPTFIAMFYGSTSVSIFAIGMTLEGYIYSFSSAISGLFLPKVSRDINSGKDIEKLAVKVGRIQLIILGWLLIGFINLGEEFISKWVGTDFSDSYKVCLLLSLPFIIVLTHEIYNTAMMVTDQVRYRSFVLIVETIICIPLSLLLTPLYGAVGAAMAIFIVTIIAEVILLSILYKRKCGYNILKFYKECHLKLFPALLISFLLSRFLVGTITTTGWLFLFLKGMLVTAIYITFVWLIGINKSEKEYLKSLSVFLGE